MSEVKLYKEVDLKETPIGKIPNDWKTTKLTDVADYINGYAFSPNEWKTDGLPIIRIQNLNDPTAEFNYFDGKIDERHLIKNGDLLFAWSASIGCYLWNRGDAWLNQHIFKVVPKQRINRQYLYYALFMAIEQLKRRVHGSTMKHFKRGELKTTLIPLPLKEKEQKAIVEVLGVVDSAVLKVDEVIWKTARLKKGLMQRLITRGIGHKEFKDTPIGTAPKTWQIAKLGVITKVTVGYVGPISEHYTDQEDGVPLFSTKNISENGIRLDDMKYVTHEFFERNKKVQVFPGDVLIARHGESGTALALPESIGVACCLNVVIVRKSERFVSKFLEYMLNLPRTRTRLIGWKSGSVQGVVNTKVLEKFDIPLPSTDEQQRIVEILSAVDAKLQLEKKEKIKLERVKRGLMDLLLTGKVRVKVD